MANCEDKAVIEEVVELFSDENILLEVCQKYWCEGDNEAVDAFVEKMESSFNEKNEKNEKN